MTKVVEGTQKCVNFEPINNLLDQPNESLCRFGPLDICSSTFVTVITPEEIDREQLVDGGWCFWGSVYYFSHFHTDRWWKQQQVNLKIQFPPQKTGKKKRKMLAVWLLFQVFQSVFMIGAYSDMDTLRYRTSGKELPGSFSISRECSRHYCEAVVFLFSDVSHTHLKDDKPVLMFILNEQDCSSAVLRSVPVNKKCTDIFWWMTNAMNFPAWKIFFS